MSTNLDPRNLTPVQNALERWANHDYKDYSLDDLITEFRHMVVDFRIDHQEERFDSASGQLFELLRKFQNGHKNE